MNFEIIWDDYALDSLNKLESQVKIRIVKKIDELSVNPFSKDIKRLKGSNYFRLRVGDYRVIFSIDKNTLAILKVGHRKNIYDR